MKSLVFVKLKSSIMEKFHVSFHAIKKGGNFKMKLYHETVLAETIEEAIKKLSETYEQIREKSHGSFPVSWVAYGVLNTLTPNTLDNALTNCYTATGEHYKPSMIEAGDKYILFEIIIKDDASEFYSNAWTSSDLIEIVARLKRYQTWTNHVDGTNSYGLNMPWCRE